MLLCIFKLYYQFKHFYEKFVFLLRVLFIVSFIKLKRSPIAVIFPISLLFLRHFFKGVLTFCKLSNHLRRSYFYIYFIWTLTLLPVLFMDHVVIHFTYFSTFNVSYNYFFVILFLFFGLYVEYLSFIIITNFFYKVLIFLLKLIYNIFTLSMLRLLINHLLDYDFDLELILLLNPLLLNNIYYSFCWL